MPCTNYLLLLYPCRLSSCRKRFVIHLAVRLKSKVLYFEEAYTRTAALSMMLQFYMAVQHFLCSMRQYRVYTEWHYYVKHFFIGVRKTLAITVITPSVRSAMHVCTHRVLSMRFAERTF